MNFEPVSEDDSILVGPVSEYPRFREKRLLAIRKISTGHGER